MIRVAECQCSEYKLQAVAVYDIVLTGSNLCHNSLHHGSRKTVSNGQVFRLGGGKLVTDKWFKQSLFTFMKIWREKNKIIA